VVDTEIRVESGLHDGCESILGVNATLKVSQSEGL